MVVILLVNFIYLLGLREIEFLLLWCWRFGLCNVFCVVVLLVDENVLVVNEWFWVGKIWDMFL